MAMVSVRTANISDSEAISELMSQLGYASSPELIERKLKEFEVRDYDQVFVALQGEEVVGVISCHITTLFHQDGASGRITSLVVQSNLNGSGIGKQLVLEAENYFRKMSCIKSEVTSGNTRTAAHEFYLSCGYTKDEQRFLKAYS